MGRSSGRAGGATTAATRAYKRCDGGEERKRVCGDVGGRQGGVHTSGAIRAILRKLPRAWKGERKSGSGWATILMTCLCWGGGRGMWRG
jgi:hypothetical protein